MLRKNIAFLAAAFLSAALLGGCGSSGSGGMDIEPADAEARLGGTAHGDNSFCTTCHGLVHTTAPSAPFDTLMGQLAVGDNALSIKHDCQFCHGGAHAPHAGRLPNAARCASCHDQLDQVVAAADHLFGGQEPNCIACHDALGLSRYEWVAERQVFSCTECHDNKLTDTALAAKPFASEIHERFATSRHANQSARSGACSACHSHEGGVELLAMGRMTSDAALKAAYTEDTVEAYLLPVGSSTIFGVNKKTCATCHDPHTSGLRGDGDVTARMLGATGTTTEEATVVFSAEFNLCTACHIVNVTATTASTSNNGKLLYDYELSASYAAANLINAETSTYNFGGVMKDANGDTLVDAAGNDRFHPNRLAFYHDGGSGNGRTFIDTHFGGTILSHLVDFQGGADDIVIKGYNINAGSTNACTICHDPHTGGKMLSVVEGQGDNIANSAIGYAQGLGDFHNNYKTTASYRAPGATGCAPCHTGDSFAATTLGAAPKTAAEGGDVWATIGCRSCHDLAQANATPNENNSTAFAAVRKFPDGYEFKFNNANAAVVTAAELGNNQVCFECHKGRSAGADVAAMADNPAGTTNYAISYLHYAPAMAILYGDDSKMVATYPGKTYAGRFAHYDGAKFGCVDCHDVHNTNGNNAATNKMTTGTCVDCHIGNAGNAFSPAGLQARTEAFSVRLLDTIYNAMMTAATVNGGSPADGLNLNLHNKLVEMSVATEAKGKELLIDYMAERQAYFPNKTIAHAVASWKIFTYEDGAVHGDGVHGHGGSWAHNSKFARQVMFDAIESLGGVTTDLYRP